MATKAKAKRAGKKPPGERPPVDAAARTAARQVQKQEDRAAASRLFKENVAMARARYAAFQDNRETENKFLEGGGYSTLYTEALAQRICTQVATNTRSLRTICLQDGMPSVSTVLRWLKEIPEFAAAYKTAKECQADLFAEDCLTIADTPQIGERTTISEKDGVQVVQEDMLAHRRLQVDVRKWLASVMRPSRYGSRVALTGAADAPPLFPLELPATPEEAMRVYLEFARGRVIEHQGAPVEDGVGT